MSKAELPPSGGEGKSRNSSKEAHSFLFINPQEFEALFKEHYKALCRYSLHFVKQETVAEEIVQDVFIKLWQKEEKLEVHTSVKAYLYMAVRNSAVNYLKSQYARQQFEEHKANQKQGQINNTQESIDLQELTLLIAEAVEQLPPQCRTIFEMSRSEGFSHEEIARELKLSPKTVENQIGIALKKLKAYLHTHWDILTVLVIMLSQTNGTL